ncbi:MAG: aspartyl protease family protein [Planctomycetota bacterium]|jgi:predicted aspartyl protease
MNIKQKALLSLVLGLTSIGLAAAPQMSSDKADSQRIVAKFPIAPKPDLIFLPVRFKEKEYWFVLDTGSSLTVFDASFRHELGAATKIVETQTAANSIIVELFDAPEAFLGPLNLQDCGEVACFDLRLLSSVLGRPISGIIGMNFLREYTIQINFDEGILSFIQPMGADKSDWGRGLAMNCDLAGCPRITGRILDQINIDFLIDTGANASGYLEHKIFRKILTDTGSKTSKVLVQTASGIQKLRETRIEDLSVGSLKYQNLIFSESKGSRLGLSFLTRHIVTFDFPNSRIYFKKGKTFNKNEEEDMSGLHLYRTSDETVVYSVDKGSPAHKAGIKTDDVILKIGDNDVKAYDMWDIREVLRSCNRCKIMMVIKRGDDIKEVSFLLKKRI